MGTPKKFHLSSGLVVRVNGVNVRAPRRRRKRAPLFSELFDLTAEGDVLLEAGGAPLDVGALSLADFHTMRALATHFGWLHEEAVEITCRNCDAKLRVAPCARLLVGPFEDGELHDAELDRTLPTRVPHAIPPVDLPGGVVARTVSFAPRSAREARPFHRALRRGVPAIAPRLLVEAGLEALGDETKPHLLARALESASPEALDAIAEIFLATHYPARLVGIVSCEQCGARNDVDAPFEREFGFAPRAVEARPFCTFSEFSEAAEEIAQNVLRDAPEIVLVIEEGVAACDDGGEPLLGGYVPATSGSSVLPSRPPEITVYFRTFRALWEEEGSYDWRAELEDTLEHEYEHHVAALVGHDPTDEEERARIRDEAERLLGRRALARSAVRALGSDFYDFLRRTWPIWLFVVIALLAVATAEQ